MEATETSKTFSMIVCMPYQYRDEAETKVQAIRIPEGGADAIVHLFKDVADEEWRRTMNANPGDYVVREATGTICVYPADIFERKFELDPDGDFI